MRSYTLVMKEDRNAVVGLFVEGVSNYDETDADVDGLQIAHDIVEHVHGLSRIGDVEDELYALGGIWAVRGQFGDIRRDGMGSMYSPEESLGADIGRMAVEVANGVYFPDRPPPRTYSHGFDDSFESALSYGRKDYRAEIGHEGMYGADQSDLQDLTRYWQWVIPAMRCGARKIKRRFGGFMAANRVFWNIVEEVQRMRPEFEGQRFKLSFDRNRVVCRELYDDYW